MDKPTFIETPELRRSFDAYAAQQRISNTKVGCWLVILLMPAGFLLDYWVYPEKKGSFFALRLLSSALAGIIFAFLFTNAGRRSGKWLGVVVPLIPVISIAGMIIVAEGFGSPYYAGLNLVLLAV